MNITSRDIEQMLYAVKRIGDAITPNVVGTTDETGGHVESLTEAVMGITSGLCKIASALETLGEIVDRKFPDQE